MKLTCHLAAGCDIKLDAWHKCCHIIFNNIQGKRKEISDHTDSAEGSISNIRIKC